MFPERAQRARGLEPPSMSHRSSTVSEEIAFQPSRTDQARMDVGMSMKILANPSAPPRRPVKDATQILLGYEKNCGLLALG